MKKRPALLTKSLSGLTTLALVFSAVPAMHIHAEDMTVVEDFGEEAVVEEATPAVYTITEFVDFKKNDEGKFTDEETQKEYGSLTAEPGTLLEDLGLPEELVLNGYYEADGPDILTTMELTDIEWILKSDIGETYSEVSPEGTYTFIPDFDTYVLDTEGLDEIKVADGLKMLTINVTIALPETEAPAETEFEEPVAEDTEYEEPIWDESEYTEDFIDDSSEEDIFSGLDDSLLGEEGDSTIITYDQDGNMIEVYTDSSLTESDIVGDGTAEDDGVVEVPGDITDDSSEPEDTTSTITVNTDLILTDANGNTLYTYSEAAQSLITLSTDINMTIPAIVVPLGCGADLSYIGINFYPQESASVNAVYTEDNSAVNDFSQNAVKMLLVEMTNPDYSISTYRVSLKLEKAEHNWSNATCETPSTCSACGATNGEAPGHSWNAATCTAPKTCSVCGATEGSAADHSWIAATCTTPKTCSVCGATEGSTADHSWIAATCTAPKTCSVCGATEGSVSGHTWVAATCTTAKTCSVCGAVEGDAPGHDWSDATCTEPKTCDTCGATKGDALGHDWSDATCTEPKTCDTCGATKGKALGHSLADDWQVTRNSTDTVHGEQIRFCHRDDCDYSETRSLNIIGDPSNNTIANLAEGGQYNLNTKITFTAVGAAMGNTNPITGDVRYVPTSWNIQNTPGNFMDGYTGAFSITQAGSYTVTVTFQKQIYQDGWKATDVVDSKSVTFTVGNLVQGTLVEGTADGIKINPQTGDNTPIVPLVIAAVAAFAAIIAVLVYKRKRVN